MQEEQARMRLREVQKDNAHLKGLLKDLVSTAKSVMDKIDDSSGEDNGPVVREAHVP